MHFRFETEQWLPFSPVRVFAFFANPANLPPLMPGWQKTRIDSMTLRPAPPAPQGSEGVLAAGDGTELLLKARPFPFSPFRSAWLARIEDFRWNEGFCDVQIRGPFRYWRHCHSVRAAADPKGVLAAGTLVHDQVEYELPLAGNSQTVNKLVVQPVFRRLFKFRQTKALELLSAHAVPF